MSEKNLNKFQYFWKSVMIFGVIFSFVISILLIVNYIQINRIDPVNSNVINSLVERLSENPEDQTLRNEIREFDLLARKAYFTTQWQIRFGIYLLFISILLVIISGLISDSFNKKKITISNDANKSFVRTQKNARRWISITGIVIAMLAIILAFLTNKNIGNKFSQKSIKINNDSINYSVVESDQSKLPISQEIDSLKNDTNSVLNNDSLITSELHSVNYPTSEMKINYPSFRGAGGNGIAYQKNIPTDWDGASGKNIKWKTSIPLPGYNSPVIWGSKVFLSGANKTKQEVYCFDLYSGKMLWNSELKNVSGAPAASPKVTDDTGYAASSVTTDGEKVYAIFANGTIGAFDFSGRKIWARNIGVPDNHYGHSSSLFVIDGKIIVQYDHKKSATVLALDSKNGNTVWSTNRDVKISWASPIIVNTGSRVEILLLANPYLASYDPSTGKELWKIKCTSGEVGPSVAYSNGIVFTVNDYAKLAAVKITGAPKIIWESTDYLSDAPSPVATDKYLILATSYGEVACYNSKTGELFWNNDFGTGSFSSPIIVGNNVYLLDKNGTMHIFKLDKSFSLVSEPKLDEKNVCTTPAFSKGKILIRTENHLYCIGE